MPEVVTIGETMLRLSAPPGNALEQASHFLVHVAGAESNVAVTLSRLSVPAGWISRLTDNALGRRIYREIRAQGVDVTRVLWTPGERVGTYFLEMGMSPRPGRVIYDRAGSAMASVDPDDVDWAYVRQARLIHLTGITPGLSPSCRSLVTRAVEEARAGGLAISFDVNYRAKLWSPTDAASTLAPLLSQVQILICTSADARLLFGLEGDAAGSARELRDMFRSLIAVVTDGIRCAAAHPGGISKRDGYRVDAADRVGAGDAFAAGFVHGFLKQDVERGLEYGTALAALKHTYCGDIAWVTEEDVQTLITGRENWR